MRWRFRRHQLDRDADAARSVTDVDLLDYGVQDTGPDGSAWALVLRGAPTDVLRRGIDPPAELAVAWTLRGAPHAYRRADLAAVATATAPWSEADAAKRVFDAASTFRKAGIDVLPALATAAAAMRTIVTKPMVKGAVSGRLSDELGEPFTRYCRGCDAVHLYEQTFRLAALQAGLVLRPGTSPPVLERVTGMRAANYRHLADEAEPRFDVLRCYLRFFGPAAISDAAAYLDTTSKEVRAHWPDDIAEVTVDGERRFVALDDVDDLDLDVDDLDLDLDRDVDGGRSATSGVVRLLAPFDPYLQARDRRLLVPDEAHRTSLWKILGRPGAVVADGEIFGTWRPKTSGGHLTLNVDLWRRARATERSHIQEQAERLAAFRGAELRAVHLA